MVLQVGAPGTLSPSSNRQSRRALLACVILRAWSIWSFTSNWCPPAWDAAADSTWPVHNHYNAISWHMRKTDNWREKWLLKFNRPIIPLSVPISSLVIRAPDFQPKVFTERRRAPFFSGPGGKESPRSDKQLLQRKYFDATARVKRLCLWFLETTLFLTSP